MTDAAPVVVLEGARLALGAVQALDGMSLAVLPGELVGLVGPDGAGKTTAIRALLGLLPLDAGTARVLDFDSAKGGRALKQAVGYLSQRFTLYGDLTVRENIDFFARLHRVRDLAARRDRLLDFTRLGPFRKRRADRLSGGMQKKLALACTLVHTPRVLFLDEPTTGVDPVSRREFWALLSQLRLQGLSVLLTTPYLDEAERCARVALVREGRTLAFDSPHSLRAAMKVAVLEVVCAPVRRARDLLAASPRVAEVQLFGDRLHLFPRDQSDRLAGLLSELPGVEVASVREIGPSLEDVFIRQVETAEGPHA